MQWCGSDFLIMDSSDSDDTPNEITEAANAVVLNLLTNKSGEKYQSEYW